MSDWDLLLQEASIVLVGDFNPAIFHPEWLVRKDIVREWDYSNDKLVNTNEMTQVSLPGNQNITVFQNQFTIRAPQASDHPAIRDIVVSAFSILSETPVRQMGMNLTARYKCRNIDTWKSYGKLFAPHDKWNQMVPYLGGLADKKKDELGLIELTMNLPRSDDRAGYVRAKIAAASLHDRSISININNHFEISSSSAHDVVKLLGEEWDNSLSFSFDLIEKIISQN